jgi:hypothetical protein
VHCGAVAVEKWCQFILLVVEARSRTYERWHGTSFAGGRRWVGLPCLEPRQ